MAFFNRQYSRGQTMPQMLIGLVVVLAVTLVAAVWLTGTVRSYQLVQPQIRSNLAWEPFAQLLIRSGQSADSVRVPTDDAFGASNADDHEVEFYYFKSAGQGATDTSIFYAICSKRTKGECSPTQALNSEAVFSYAYADLPQNGGNGATQQGTAETSVGPCTFTPLVGSNGDFANAALNPSMSKLFKTAAFPSPNVYQWGYPLLVSRSDQVVLASCTTSDGTRQTGIGNPRVNVSVQVPVGVQTPTPNPLSAQSLVFRAPVALSQTSVISELNYGTRTTAPAQDYTLGAASGQTPCEPAHATHTPANPVYPNGYPNNAGNGDADVVFTPVIAKANSNGACVVQVTDNVGQVADISIAIGTVYAPQSTADFVFKFGTGNNQAQLAVSEENYALPPAQGGNGGFGPDAPYPSGVAVTGPCKPPAMDSATIADGNDYTETEKWTVTFTGAGVCKVTFTDVYGQVATTNITVQSSVPLTWPPGVQFPFQGSALANCATDQPKALDAGGNILANGAPPAGFATGYTTDKFGCMWAGANPVNQTKADADGVSALVYEQNYPNSGLFSFSNPASGTECSRAFFQPVFLGNGGPNASMIGSAQSSGGTCAYGVSDQYGAPVTASNTVQVQVIGCPGGGGTGYLPVGGSCSFVVPGEQNNNYVCDKEVSYGGSYTFYFPSFLGGSLTAGTSAYGTLSYSGTEQSGGVATFTRTAAGSVTVYVNAITATPHNDVAGDCGTSYTGDPYQTTVIN